MATLRPSNLKTLSFYIEAAAVQFTDLIVAMMPNDAKIFYIDVVVHDAAVASSFTGGTVLLEYSSTIGGTQTEIDSITVTADVEFTQVTLADLTNSVVPGGSYIAFTGATLANISDGFQVFIHYVDLQEE